MKILFGMLVAVSIGLVGASASPAQDQKLAVTKVESVKEVEPSIVEIVVTLENGSKATLRMNVFTMQDLGARFNRIRMWRSLVGRSRACYNALTSDTVSATTLARHFGVTARDRRSRQAQGDRADRRRPLPVACGDATGRLGCAFDRVLVYGKGGGAFSDGFGRTTSALGGFAVGPTNTFVG
jgi:hypothetical protein